MAVSTGQTILDLMEVLDQELQLQSGEADVTKALVALNAAQDFLEALIAAEPELRGDTISTVTTTANVESTAFPTALLRLDRIQFIDPTTSLPVYDLTPIKRTGGHRSSGWPWTLYSSTSSGQPRAYWTDGRSIYWDPLPDATYTLRWYGFQSASDITAGGTFAYPDICMLPLASLAVKFLQLGVGDDSGDVTGLAFQTLIPVVKTLASFDRDGAQPFQYTRFHIT